MSRILTLVAAVCLAGWSSARAGALTPVAHVEVSGTGPTAMVLIPGMACDWTVWREFMERNGERYTMYAVTLPGFGGSAAPPYPELPEGTAGLDPADPTPWMDNAVAAVARVIEERGLDKPVVMGHSLGGHLALKLGIERPGLVGWVIDVDGMPVFPMGAMTTAQNRVDQVNAALAPAIMGAPDDVWVESLARNAERSATDLERALGVARMIRATPARVLKHWYLEMVVSDLTLRMAEMAPPTLLMAAISDPLPSMDLGETRQYWQDMDHYSATSTSCFYLTAKHFLMWDRPEEFDRDVADFVAGKKPKGYTPPEHLPPDVTTVPPSPTIKKE